MSEMSVLKTREPEIDKNGLPLHRDECPIYDGKRCGHMGFKPDRFCEPALVDMAAELKIAGTNQERNRLLAERYGAISACDVLHAEINKLLKRLDTAEAENGTLRLELAETKRGAAPMRTALEQARQALVAVVAERRVEPAASAFASTLAAVEAALASGLGEGWRSPQEWDEALKKQNAAVREKVARIHELRLDDDGAPCECGECSQCLARQALAILDGGSRG